MDKKVKAVLDSYDPKKITIGTICSHSALQIFYGAKQEGFKTVGVGKPDRKATYDAYAAATPDVYIEVNDWSEILTERVQQELIAHNTIMIPHGSFVEYVGLSNMIGGFYVPVLGNRSTLEWEADRASQRKWLLAAGLITERIYLAGRNRPENICEIPWRQRRQGLFHRFLEERVLSADERAGPGRTGKRRRCGALYHPGIFARCALLSALFLLAAGKHRRLQSEKRHIDTHGIR